MKLKLKLMQDKDVLISSQAGHYVSYRGDEAQIITVGAYRGRKAYAKAMPGYVIKEVTIMETPNNPELDGTFISVILKRG